MFMNPISLPCGLPQRLFPGDLVQKPMPSKFSMNHRLHPSLMMLAFAAGASTAGAAIVIGSPVQNIAINHALTGTASASSTGYGGVASRAIDGNVNGYFSDGSTTHSDENAGINQSWQVDLGTDRAVDQVIVYNRDDGCCPGRLSNYRVSLLAGDGATVAFQDFPAAPLGGAQPVNFGGATGRTVKVEILGLNGEGTNVLSLAEVTVLDYINYPNIAAGKPASQSSIGFGGSAARANDGDTSGVYSWNSISHTGNVVGPVWWETDLEGDFAINEIAIYSRTDCCPERNGNYRLSILDNGSEVWGMDVAPGAPGSTINIGSLFTVWENSGGFIATGDKVRISLIGDRNNAPPNGEAERYLMLADVQVFGTVPEPGTALLAALSGLCLMSRRRR